MAVLRIKLKRYCQEAFSRLIRGRCTAGKRTVYVRIRYMYDIILRYTVLLLLIQEVSIAGGGMVLS